MSVYKYTSRLANDLRIADKVKPEPWLHAAIELEQEGMSLAIYVWDTREVVFSKFTPFKSYDQYRRFADQFYEQHYSKAADSHEPLNWSSCKKLKAIDEHILVHPIPKNQLKRLGRTLAGR